MKKSFIPALIAGCFLALSYLMYHAIAHKEGDLTGLSTRAPIALVSPHLARLPEHPATISAAEADLLLKQAFAREYSRGPYKTTTVYTGAGWTRTEVTYFKPTHPSERLMRLETTFSRSMLNVKNKRYVSRTNSSVVLKQGAETWTLVNGIAIKHPADPLEETVETVQRLAAEFKDASLDIAYLTDTYSVNEHSYLRLNLYFPERMRSLYATTIADNAYVRRLNNGASFDGKQLRDRIPVKRTVVIDQFWGFVVYDGWLTEAGTPLLENRIDSLETVSSMADTMFKVPDDAPLFLPKNADEFSALFTGAAHDAFNRSRILVQSKP